MRESKEGMLTTLQNSTSKSQSLTRIRKVKKALLLQSTQRSRSLLPLIGSWETSASLSTPSTNPRKRMTDRNSQKNMLPRLKPFSEQRQLSRNSKKLSKQIMLRVPFLNFPTKFLMQWSKASLSSSANTIRMKSSLFSTKSWMNRQLRLTRWGLSKRPKKLPTRRLLPRLSRNKSRNLPRELTALVITTERRPLSKDSVTSSKRFQPELPRSNLRKMTTRPTPRFSLKLITFWTRQPLRSFPSKMDSERDLRTFRTERVISRRSPIPRTRTETRQEFQERPMTRSPSRTACSQKISSNNEKSFPSW